MELIRFHLQPGEEGLVSSSPSVSLSLTHTHTFSAPPSWWVTA